MFIEKAKQALQSTTGRLSLSYLAIIMAMSIGFSIVFYHTTAREFNREPRSNSMQQVFGIGGDPRVEAYLDAQAAAAKRSLVINLVLLNMLTLGAGAYVSYVLARKTLEPIEQAMEAQTRFASDASHELRTPLAAIQAENEVALRKSNLTLTRAKELLTSNLEEAGKLRLLAEGLLQLTRAENATIPDTPVSLSDITITAINRVIQPAQDKNIAIEDTVDNLTVRGDAQLLAQTLVILLDNAIKYSPPKSIITLGAEAAGKHAVIRVTDQGTGISETDQLHIFERFYRADPSRSNQHTPGYGLGLSIAQKIIELHHGQISVDSSLGHGTTFTVRLPLT